MTYLEPSDLADDTAETDERVDESVESQASAEPATADELSSDDAPAVAEAAASTEPVGSEEVTETVASADVDEVEPAEAATEEPEAEAVEEPGEVELSGDEELVEVEDVDRGPKVISPYDRPGDWYVVHTYSGYENKVKNNLASRVRSMGVEERIHEVVIPMEDVIEFKGGRKTVVQKKVFPGYLLCRMNLDDNSWYVVRNTPGVTGFVGSGAKPTPLSRREVEDILGVEQLEGEKVEKKARPRLEFEVGDQVRVTQGPFADFDGAIAEIDEDRARLKVLVNIFGRETPVELEFGQVSKL